MDNYAALAKFFSDRGLKYLVLRRSDKFPCTIEVVDALGTHIENLSEYLSFSYPQVAYGDVLHALVAKGMMEHFDG